MSAAKKQKMKKNAKPNSAEMARSDNHCVVANTRVQSAGTAGLKKAADNATGPHGGLLRSLSLEAKHPSDTSTLSRHDASNCDKAPLSSVAVALRNQNRPPAHLT